MSFTQNTEEILRQTSRTFFLAIVDLPPRLRDVVTSAYLSLRAIDEIEDHPNLDRLTKISLLSDISDQCHMSLAAPAHRLSDVLKQHRDQLPEVTNRLDEWISASPSAIARRLCDSTSTMAKKMAYWVANDWRMTSESELQRYTFDVAGSVGLLLSDLWIWYDGTRTVRKAAIGFGRGLQAVNIIRNRSEDLARGVDLYPKGWTDSDLAFYARRNLVQADAYVAALTSGVIKNFCNSPLMLAYATLDAIARGEPKLSRSMVLRISPRQNAPDKVKASFDHMHWQTETDARYISSNRTDLGISVGPQPQSSYSQLNKFRETEDVILVNEKDEVVGIEEKMRTHLRGVLHRAFSIFIFNSNNQLLVQKRAENKYHSKGLWSNACCGHPRPGENTEKASRRRLREEMGFDCDLKKVFDFIYRAKLEDRISEHEYDHVFVGKFDGIPEPNRDEVGDWKWVDLTTLKVDIQRNPQVYTYWFKFALDMLLNRI